MVNGSHSNIWQLQSHGDVLGIIAALDTPDPAIRGRAVMALRMLGDQRAVQPLLLLREQELNPTIQALVEHALRVLAPNQTYQPTLTADDNRRDVLIDKLRNGSLTEAQLAVLELGKMQDHSAVEHLILIFRDTTRPAALRLTVAEVLLQLDSAPASVSLLGALRKPDWQVRRNAAAVLGQIWADWAVEPLIEVMKKDPSMTVRKTAAAALRRINTTRALQALRQTPSQR